MLEDIMSAITCQLNPGTIERYRSFLANEMESAPSVNLPAGLSTRRMLDITSRVMISIRGPIHVSANESSSVFRLRWNANDLHFSKEQLSLFLILNDGQSHAVSDLLAPCSSPQSRVMALAFLMQLCDKGIIVSC